MYAGWMEFVIGLHEHQQRVKQAAIKEDHEKEKGKGDEGHCDGLVSDSLLMPPASSFRNHLFPNQRILRSSFAQRT